MAHFINALFFVAVLVGGAAIIALTVREYWNEIMTALAGAPEARGTNRPWTGRVRVVSRPQPQAARAARQRAAA